MKLTLYSFLKFLHVLLAVVAVGFNASYGIWLARVAKEPEHAPHVLRGIKFLDDRIANPAYGLLLLLGLAMVWEAGIPFSTFWIAASLVLYAVLVIVAVAGYSPALRRQVSLAEAGRVDSHEYRQAARRGGISGGILGVIVVVIILFMVTKPTL
ncbi:MAG: DUF2269 family protein [Actinobacteria bacterium]|nr:DUF2269 family protein [Actinomycetota bacterium]